MRPGHTCTTRPLKGTHLTDGRLRPHVTQSPKLIAQNHPMLSTASPGRSTGSPNCPQYRWDSKSKAVGTCERPTAHMWYLASRSALDLKLSTVALSEGAGCHQPQRNSGRQQAPAQEVLSHGACTGWFEGICVLRTSMSHLCQSILTGTILTRRAEAHSVGSPGVLPSQTDLVCWPPWNS